MHGRPFEGVQSAWFAYRMGGRNAQNGSEAVGISRLHDYRPEHAHRSSGVRCAGTEAPRVDSKSNARNPAAQLSCFARLAGEPCGFVLARPAQSRRNCLGRAERRPEFRSNGGRTAREEGRASGGGRTTGNGVFRPIRFWRRSWTFAGGAGTHSRVAAGKSCAFAHAVASNRNELKRCGWLRNRRKIAASVDLPSPAAIRLLAAVLVR